MRRAQTTKNLGLLVLLGATVALLLFFAAQKLYGGDDAIAEEECRRSIDLHSKAVRASADIATPYIRCEPHNLTLSTRNDARARKALADEMVFCWDRWQRGEATLFAKDGLYCNPCSVITLEGAPLAGFTQYLLETPAKRDGMTYAEYLLSTRSANAEGNVEVPSAPVLSELAPGGYAVVFVYARGTSVQRIKDNWRNPAYNVKELTSYSVQGAVAGAALGIAAVVIGVGTGGVGFAFMAGTAAVAGGALGAGTFGYLGWVYGDAPAPEYLATVQLLPNTDEAYRSMGCDAIQQGGPATVDKNGAEII